MKLRIVNETGVTKHTSVFDENGNDLANYIKKMTLHFPIGGVITADIELFNVSVEVLAEFGIAKVAEEEEADA